MRNHTWRNVILDIALIALIFALILVAVIGALVWLGPHINACFGCHAPDTAPTASPSPYITGS